MTLPPAPTLPTPEQELIAAYRRAQEKIIADASRLSNMSGQSLERYRSSLFVQSGRVLNALQKESAAWAAKNVPTFVQKGVERIDRQIDEQFEEAGETPPQFVDSAPLIATAGAAFTDSITEQLDTIINTTRQNLAAGFNGATNTAFDDEPVKTAQAQVIALLTTQGVIGKSFIRDGGLVGLTLAAIGSTTIRSLLNELLNLVGLGRTQETVGDLVQMTSHATACPICWPLQGRVYSISGRSSVYPPLDAAFSGGHANIHPNCMHVILPYIPALQSPEEIRNLLAFSNRPFDISQMSPELQALFRANDAIYQAQQASKAAATATRNQWERYKLRLGSDAPQRLSTFSRIKNADGARWAELQADFRKRGVDIKQQVEQ